MNRFLGLLIAFVCIFALVGCQQTRLEELAYRANSQCPYYIESGWYVSQVYIDYDECALVLDVAQDSEFGQSIFGGIFGLTGAIGLNTFVSDQLLQVMHSDDNYSLVLNLCRNTGVDIIFRICGEEFRIDSWKL